MPDVSRASVDELVSLAGRVAVVTGAGQGIGRATVRRFAQAGADVVLADLRGEAARTAAAELGAELGVEIRAAEVDVGSRASVEALGELAAAPTGAIDVWANFAAVYPMRREQFAPALELSDEEWERTLRVNTSGSFLCSQVAARHMVAGGRGGVVLNTMTTVVDRYPGHVGMAAYATSKGGLEQLTKILAAELGPHGIRVLALKPTVISTEGLEEHRATLAGVMGVDDPFGGLAAVIPAGRLGVPDDVARVALFAASDLSLFMTGCVLPVDGGELAI